MRKLHSIELTMGMSATATDYTYTIYIWQNFSFDEERMGWACVVMTLYIHVT
jgi:hypothetical protein